MGEWNVWYGLCMLVCDVGPVIFRDRGKVAEFAELPT